MKISKKILMLCKVVLILSLVGNVWLGMKIYQLSNNSKSVQSVEEASGIKNFQYRVPCNTVFGYKVCTADFVGLGGSDAIYKARTHGLDPLIYSRDGKSQVVFVSEEPFRINFKLKNGVVTEAFFQ